MMTGWGDITLGAWLWMGIWILALLAMVWLLVRNSDTRRGDDAERILRARFARGEITQAEFEQARRLLASEKQ